MQLASDLRHAHERDPAKLRITGVLPGDRWEAAWGPDPEDPEVGRFYVWIRWASDRRVESAW